MDRQAGTVPVLHICNACHLFHIILGDLVDGPSDILRVQAMADCHGGAIRSSGFVADLDNRHRHCGRPDSFDQIAAEFMESLPAGVVAPYVLHDPSPFWNRRPSTWNSDR